MRNIRLGVDGYSFLGRCLLCYMLPIFSVMPEHRAKSLLFQKILPRIFSMCVVSPMAILLSVQQSTNILSKIFWKRVLLGFQGCEAFEMLLLRKWTKYILKNIPLVDLGDNPRDQNSIDLMQFSISFANHMLTPHRESWIHPCILSTPLAAVGVVSGRWEGDWISALVIKESSSLLGCRLKQKKQILVSACMNDNAHAAADATGFIWKSTNSRNLNWKFPKLYSLGKQNVNWPKWRTKRHVTRLYLKRGIHSLLNWMKNWNNWPKSLVNLKLGKDIHAYQVTSEIWNMIYVDRSAR